MLFKYVLLQHVGMPLIIRFESYISTLTLSLFFFNLLPLPYLDGSQLFEALLDYIQGIRAARLEDRAVDLELAYADRRARQPEYMLRLWRTRVQKGAQLISSVLMVVTLVLSILHAMQ